MNPAEMSRSGSSDDSELGSKRKGFFANLMRKMKKKQMPGENMINKPEEPKPEQEYSSMSVETTSKATADSEEQIISELPSSSAFYAVETASTTLTETLNFGLSLNSDTSGHNLLLEDVKMEDYFKDDYYKDALQDEPFNYGRPNVNLNVDNTYPEDEDEFLLDDLLLDTEDDEGPLESPEAAAKVEENETIEKLLSLRCRYQPIIEMDKLSSDALAVKLWILLHITKGNFPAILPMMSLRQTIVFSKLHEIFQNDDLPLDIHPPQNFHSFVDILWTSSYLNSVPTGIVPKDLEAVNNMLKDKEIRIFEIGCSVKEALEIWEAELKNDYASDFNIFNGINSRAEDFLSGPPCASTADFITTLQCISMSPDFIKMIDFDVAFFRHLEPQLGVAQSKHIPSFPISIFSDFQTMGEIARLFWTETDRYDSVILLAANQHSWVWSNCDWDWLVESLKRKPRKIVGLWQKNEIIREKIRMKAEQRQKDLDFLRNADMPNHFEWDEIVNEGDSSSGITGECTDDNNLSGALPDTYTCFEPARVGHSTNLIDDWGDDDSLPPPILPVMRRHTSSTKLYSTDSEQSLQSCRRSLDQISLTSTNSDLVDPGY